MFLRERLLLAFLFCLSFITQSYGLHARPRATDGEYLVGVGKADIMSGPVEYNFMGYASATQRGTGLRQRVFSRAFIVASTTENKDRWIYVIADLASGDTAIRRGVMDKLNSLYPGLYGENLALVGTHSHSSAVTTAGFAREVYDPIVNGIVESIKQAHESLAPGRLKLGKGRLEDANINRSLFAYQNNPKEERDRYGNDSVEKEMTVLGFERADGTKIGMLNWFPVHGTSMYNNNTLITGDNKGVAAYIFEKKHPNFVAGFSQANVGDTSPNTRGSVCQDTGLECDFQHSTCGGKNKMCMGRGPAFPSDTESCRIIGKRQNDAAESIWNSMNGDGGTRVSGGGVKWVHKYVDFSKYSWEENGVKKQTCPAAMGYAFAAGTTDGPGQFDFIQNDPFPPGNPYWQLLRNVIRAPSKEQIACHMPKPILLDVGEMTFPYLWTPNVVEIQMLRVGQFAIIVASGEATTMSGRRWKNAVAKALKDQGILEEGVEPWVVIGGPANTYAHYITTPEEYEIQRYEGASTLFGKWTLDAYIHLALENVKFLADNAATPTDGGPLPPVFTAPGKAFNLNPPVVYDGSGAKKFGDVLTQPNDSYRRGSMASAKFVGANPRNNLRTGSTYLTVEKKQADGSWVTVRNDNDWTTVYRWKRTNEILGQSDVTIEWEIEDDAEPGIYRIVYNGDWKHGITKKITAFSGTSRQFTVT